MRQFPKKQYTPLTDPKIWIAASLLMGIVVFILSLEHSPVDPKTFCSLNGNAVGATAIVIDASDRMTPAQALGARTFIKTIDQASVFRETAFAVKGTKLSGYILTEDSQPTSFLNICHPGTSAERDKITESERIFSARLKRFSTTLDRAIETTISGDSELKSSPILETLAYVRSSENFPPPDLIAARDDRHTIILVSNLVQNSSLTSHFNGLEDAEAVFKKAPISLRGIRLHVLFLSDTNYQHIQTPAFKTWWRKYFALTGVSLTWSTL